MPNLLWILLLAGTLLMLVFPIMAMIARRELKAAEARCKATFDKIRKEIADEITNL